MDKLDTRIIENKSLVKNRIWELDFLRGICIFLMVMDHTFFDIGQIFDTAWLASGSEATKLFVGWTKYYWNMPLRLVTQEIVVWTLFIICGISNSFSRSNLKRGLQLMGVGLLITLVTMALSNQEMFDEGVIIRFGVIHMLASCILIWCVINCIFHDPYKTAAASLVVAIIVLSLNATMDTLTANYVAQNNFWGFISEYTLVNVYTFSPGDYFPLIPYLGVFMIGSAIGPVLYKDKKSLLPFLDVYNWYRPINILGRNTLWIVVFHQPVITLILILISGLFVTKGDFVFF